VKTVLLYLAFIHAIKKYIQNIGLSSKVPAMFAVYFGIVTLLLLYETLIPFIPVLFFTIWLSHIGQVLVLHLILSPIQNYMKSPKLLKNGLLLFGLVYVVIFVVGCSPSFGAYC
jgi:hypothetical protein